MPSLPPFPHSWSELTWQQLCDCWQVKLCYGGNADVARVAALVALLQLKIENRKLEINYAPTTGERLYALSPLHRGSGQGWVTTARELAWMAKKAIPWFDFPYGDPGEKEQKDDKGKVVRERRDAVRGYVSPMRDAMMLPMDRVTVRGFEFELPQACCANLSWEQYRSLQGITSQLFQLAEKEEEKAIDLQAQFLANCLIPAQKNECKDKFAPKYIFKFDSLRAEGIIPFWRLQIPLCPPIFHICFQVYQTAISYYSEVYPLLFSGEEKHDPLRDALTGEAGTINTIMKYQGYTDPQAVYEANLPVILDTLNTMTKEAKEIEKMNAKIKRK